MALPIIPAILSFFSGWFVRIIGSEAARALIWKAILYTLLVTILPTVLYNFLSGLLTEFLDMATEYGSDGQALNATFTGMMGWLALQLKIPEAFSILISAFTFRITISFIPFLSRI
jgi:hypothetical protein